MGCLNPTWTLKIVKFTVKNMGLKQQWNTGIEELIRLVLKIYMDPMSEVLLEGQWMFLMC